MEPSTSDLIDVLVRLPRSTVRQFIETRQVDATERSARRLAIARTLLAARRRRGDIFGGLRFVEPAWDMILTLYAAALEGRRTNVLKLCAVSGASNTTALRLIESLEAQGYVVRKPDEADARGVLIVMLPALETALDEWIDAFGDAMRCDRD